MALTDQGISKITKGRGIEVRVILSEFNGYRLLSIRGYYQPDDDENFRPTKRGCAIPTVSIPAFIEAVEASKGTVE